MSSISYKQALWLLGKKLILIIICAIILISWGYFLSMLILSYNWLILAITITLTLLVIWLVASYLLWKDINRNS